MSATTNYLDKTFNTLISDSYGTISIRIVVLQKPANDSSVTLTPEEPDGNEPLLDVGKTPVSSYLENPKKGRECIVFLINGQKQHALDNSFIQSELGFKYLRNRMIVVVELDNLRPECVAHLMQGSRYKFYEGKELDAITHRLIATLKGDPDIIKLETEAEEEIYKLKSGDDVIKTALDKLIEDHHNLASHFDVGIVEKGEKNKVGTQGSLDFANDYVIRNISGPSAKEPLLILNTASNVIRVKPGEAKRLILTAQPSDAWKDLIDFDVKMIPPVNNLHITENTSLMNAYIDLYYEEPSDTDSDGYPIETTLQIIGTFKDCVEPRLVENRLLINKAQTLPPPPPPVLLDDPTYVRVTNRQPIRFVQSNADIHVKMKWDGKDYLTFGDTPQWTFKALCLSNEINPLMAFSQPHDGRFELLIQVPSGLTIGELYNFEVKALGPNNKSLITGFEAEVAPQPEPKKITKHIEGGSQRRPPYNLVIIQADQYNQETCWGNSIWTDNDPGCFQEPTSKSPLTLIINQDLTELEHFRDLLLSRKLAENTIKQRMDRYTTHVAFHLYQMYKNCNCCSIDAANDNSLSSDESMRHEIQRVATTLLKLMDI
ncbi:MAG: hypothetical protein LLF76_06815 [Planctomycetaceae bacterium]|nr:hypothetical protein [Planctomycetaceae bacterium]